MSKQVKAVKFTFKRQPRRTGLSAVGYPESDVDIKLAKKIVGHINAPNWDTKDRKWGIQIAVAEARENCQWSWRFFKRRFDTEQEARDWLQENAAKIVAMNLHAFDEY